MKVVKSFDVKEFRGIRRLERPMELGKFNVLVGRVGRNCSGKTSILQALYLLAMPMVAAWISPYSKSAITYVEGLVKEWNRLVYGYSGEASMTSSHLEAHALRRRMMFRQVQSAMRSTDAGRP
jgi:AAA15 family ATPase/GTPase